MDKCVFCKIVNKSIPSYKVYEDNNVYAFLDITPSTKGHTLVIPKKHFTDIYEMTTEDSKIFASIPLIARALRKAFDPIGINIINNNQKPYQSVFHYHIHLIPRYSDDQFNIDFPHLQYNEDDLKDISKAIQTSIFETK